MRIGKPGKIADGLWLLGREESNVYLLEGKKESLLISGGLCTLIPDILDQFREFRIDESRIDKLLILHSHFDHVGIVPFFKRRNPGMRIYASSRALEIFRKPKAIQAMNAANRFVLENAGDGRAFSGYDLEWRPDVSGEAVSEGDELDLGDMEVRILETPGHSPCSISAYVPRLKALFSSDAGGIPFRERILTYGTSDYTKFEESLRKFRDREVNIVCSDHCGCVTGEEGARFVEATIEAARQRRQLMRDTFGRLGSIEQAARVLAAGLLEENVGNMVSTETFTEAFRQMIRHVVENGP